MGIVYLADDTRLARPVALKACGLLLPRRQEQLRREARAAAALAHAGIATVYALEEIEGELYLVSEYVPGPTLRRMLDTGRLDPALVLDVATQLARALAAAHAQGVVHGDLTPANVVRTAAGVVKILDFGVARVGGGDPAEDAAGRRVPAAGTPGYMAPEQIRDGEVTFRTDLFAFGVLVYELAAGRHPWDGHATAARMAAIPDPARPPLPAAVSRLEPIIATCLRERPEDRYTSTSRLVADLDRLHLTAAEARHTPAGATPMLEPRWWWAAHQAIVSLVYVLMLYPAWRARTWLPLPWGSIFLGTALAGATAATTLRLNLWFTARFYPAELTRQRRKTRRWVRLSDVTLAAALLLAASGIEGAHGGMAMLFVTVAVALVVASLLIEPTTVNAAFGPLDGDDDGDAGPS
jgi:hypothetical protein